MLNDFIQGLVDFQFLQNALVTSVMVGISAGIIGSFIILRGMSLMGDAISHAVLPGVALSYMLGSSYIIGATVFGMASAALIGFVTKHSRLKNDTAIGIVFSAFFALGIILISFARSSTDLYHILFGNVLAVRDSDMLLTAAVLIIVLIAVPLFYKQLKLTSFAPTIAKSYGWNTSAINYGLMFLLTLVAVTSLQTVGTILVIAMLITPAATAYQLTDKLLAMIVLSTVFGTLSSIVGLYFSYSYNLPSGATIVMAAAMFFIVAFIFAPKKGLIGQLRKENLHDEE
ncbi:iron/zinc/copper transport system permease protein [Trichococcus patagoniensis]|uniref:Manganese import system permease protein ScaB n=1 Tax=Trichococcus patagoniensis TaxID=382641 RepID=A0A2T5IMT4_9LACT|nr:metal ABC transporter permease [Trichococcus patagoniensis]PTQ85147.1 iron/zinc/copper transport system permease protein [Trichococcus patagoniensis]